MNTVPFDQLGPGQSGRLVYQVMGQNGPIYNPNNITYLPADSPLVASFTGAGASGLEAGLMGVNLISSFLNLAVSGYIAHQVRALNEKMDILQETVSRIEHKIDYITKRVERIDVQVAENNLRHALEYALQKAVSPEGIDLRILSNLGEDILTFNDSLSSSLIPNFGLRISSDVRDRLQMICNLLYGIRKLIAQRHNAYVDGDPERVITMTPTMYLSDEDFGLAGLVKLDILIEGVYDELLRHKEAMLGFAILSQQEFSDCADFHTERLMTLFANTGAIDLSECHPEGLEALFNDEAPETIEKGLYDICCTWLYHTDAGLLWRTYLELAAISEGYENAFWPELKEAEPCRIDQIDVVCDLPLIENSSKIKKEMSHFRR